MSAETLVGIVEEVINNGKGSGSGIRVAGHKYGVYDPKDANLDEVAEGTTVSFRFKEKAGSGGVVYKNIQGKITTVKDGTPVTATPTSSGDTSTQNTKSGYRRNGEEGGFPIHAKAYERALDRRNALNAAVKFCESVSTPTVDEVLDVARQFEAYTTGDDLAEAEARMAFINDGIE